ncbi:hypothetical protein [Bacillus sp. Au-Bac7]|uniref:hypothetical protein n=1 Tax=Bacillus sp. Au-Bac7 TaxID=2906458 RepID=UPI001E572D16|nr:hypothetical protein [Bacillus sp. Au-Bac7]MCE4048969.1 hypothetical protein [Bacillus sp. Au-Bac7]
MTTIYVVVEKDSNLTKYIPAIRKNTYLGVSDIKNRIEFGDPIIEWELFKEEEQDGKVQILIKLLLDAGAGIKYYKGQLTPRNEVKLDYILNVINRYKEIQEQIQDLDDLMFGKDE